MQTVKPRAVLRSFRALAFHGENRGDATGIEMRMDMQQDIELGLAVPTVSGGSLQVSVFIKLKATATNVNDAKDQATFAGDYEAKFYYATEVEEEQVTPLMDDSEYQYLHVAQAFPLAMTHFRRELQALGLDARQLPLGLQ
jgi:hypothetical protein